MEALPLFGDDEAPVVRRVTLLRLGSELARAMGGVGRVAVEGEVVRPNRHPGGTYFTLKDRTAQVSVRCPAAKLRRCRTEAGERVQVTGSLVWQVDRGQVQLVAEEVVPVGAGAVAALLVEVQARLEAEGLTSRRRRALPRLPATIGVVCGSEAAVRADIESVVAARFPGYPMAWATTNVSGPGAAEGIMSALRRLEATDGVDVIILARGGGDATQLLPWSDEELCRAVASCTTPVVSAIGHDGDRPLCDLVADLRCGTPSLAAGAVVPDRRALEAELEALATRRQVTLEARVSGAAARLTGVRPADALSAGLARAANRHAAASGRLTLVDPSRRLPMAAAALARVDWRAPLRRRHQGGTAELAALRRQLDALDPARVLERGYAVVRTTAGLVVRDPAAVAAGDRLELTVAGGRLGATVTDR